ncbi:MAG: hypothetical protein HY362_02865 [Candidatus Aenigmarchaeota archaeon]|nr:hypothetical protein [Candidatus Aenigmarchaeota archaeon]
MKHAIGVLLLVSVFALFFASYSTAVLADDDIEAAEVEDNKVTFTQTDSLVSGFVLNQPITWDRTVYVHNPTEKNKKVKIKLGKGAEVVSVPDGVKMEGKKKFVIKAPSGDSVWIIRFETAPITVTEQVLNSDPANYNKIVTVSSNYHYTNIPALTSLPNLPATHVYSITPQSTGQETRKVLYDNDGDGNKDSTRWTVAHLSTESFGVAAQKVPSRISNYKFETGRANNDKKPDGWTLTQDPTARTDAIDWGYDPLEAGWQSSSSLRVKHLGTYRIYSDNLSTLGTGTFNISFDFNPQFESGAICNWAFGVEVFFATGESDTSLPFEIDSAGNIVSTPGEYNTVVTPLTDGWYHVDAKSNVLIDPDKSMQFYIDTESCNQFPGSSVLMDNVVFEA